MFIDLDCGPQWLNRSRDFKGEAATVSTVQGVKSSNPSKCLPMRQQHSLSAVSVLHSRQEEQTCPTGPHVQMSTPVKVTLASIKANRLDTPATCSLSSEPLVLGPSPSRVQSDTVLPTSRETLISSCMRFCVFTFPL